MLRQCCLVTVCAFGLFGAAAFAQSGAAGSSQSSSAAGDSSSPNSGGTSSKAPHGTGIGSYETPKLVSQVDPQYSKQARKAKKSGVVLIGLLVDEKGVPQQVHVIRGVGYGLDEKALEAVSKYRFRPALKNGTPVPARLNVEVNFQVLDGPPPALNDENVSDSPQQ